MITRHDSPVVQQVSRFMIRVIRLFAVYVLFHGHYSPGGGFQAGILIGASFILEFLVGTRYELKEFSIQKEFRTAAIGVLIYCGIGLIAMVAGHEFLNYGKLTFLSDYEPKARYYSILIAEIGITFVVSMTLVVIFHILAFLPDRGRDH